MCLEGDGYESVESTYDIDTSESSDTIDVDEELTETENSEEQSIGDTELTDNEELIGSPEKSNDKSESDMDISESENSDVSPEVRAEINEKSEYSSEVNDHMHSVEELEVYQKAGLKEESIDGRTCLVRDDIDYDYVDEKTGMTNRELMEKGRAPYDAKSGERIELHHIGQDYDSPLAELTSDSEHGDGNHSVLHTKESDSWRQDSEKNNHYNGVQRPNHWKSRV